MTAERLELMKMPFRSGIGCIELIELHAILRTYGPYLSTDELATICMPVLPPVQHQLKAHL
jgi:hypothetical protein